MNYSTSRSYLLAWLVFSLGVVLSLLLDDWSWFARSGSAVVALGIVLTSHQIFEHHNQLEKQRRARSEEKGTYDSEHPKVSHYQHDWANKNSIRQLIRSRSHEEEIWRSEFSGFYMLVTGTLVWGFGDLVGYLL